MRDPTPEQLNEIVNDFIKEAEVDYVGLWEIAKIAREELGAKKLQDVRSISLQIARALYQNGLRPGDYDYGTHVDFWPDEGCQAMLDRIDREWVKLNADPTHLDPICSFLRPRT